MANIKGSVTQSGADTTSHTLIETNLTADGKTGWEVYAIEAYWVNGEAVAAADWEMRCGVTTVNSTPSFISADEFCSIGWGVQNTGGVAVALPYDPIKSLIFIEPRLTVQPVIYFYCVSQLTGQANTVQFRIYYNEVKLGDLEVLRLLAGGA